MKKFEGPSMSRRGLLKAGATAAAGAVVGTAGITAPLAAYGKSGGSKDPIRIGVVEPLTGTYAALGGNEVNGARMAAEEINGKGGVLGRPLQLHVEDTNANVGTGVQKARKLMEREKVDFLMGGVSSAVALAIAQTAHEKGKVYMVTGGHTDAITGSKCKWNVFRVCTTTYMLAAGIAKTLFDKFGKRWYFLTPDYAFGHTEQEAFASLLKGMGGTVLGNALVPLGTTDFSSPLIRAKSANPDVLVVLQAGNDLVNALKQATQFGLNKEMAIGGGMMELEALAALPDDARLGWWTFEWYWDQPGVPHVKDFVDRYRKKYNSYPTARSWFGYVGCHSLAMGAQRAGSVDSVKVAKAIEGMHLPPEIALEPHSPFFRAGDHQLMADLFPGEVNSKGKYPHLFNVATTVEGDKIAHSVEEKECKMSYSS